VYLTLTSDSKLRSKISSQTGNLTVPQFAFLALLITLAAIATDQFAAPTLYSSSPLWAAAASLLLVWRRDRIGFERDGGALPLAISFKQNTGDGSLHFTLVRIAFFSGAHFLLVNAAWYLESAINPIAGTNSFGGWVIAALKLSLLLPTLLLFPLPHWRSLARTYASEGIAALVVLFTFFPGRILMALWPWYGQVLGRVVFFSVGLFVPGLTNTSALNPTLHGPDLDVSILFACSGISGIELFDLLFGFVVLLDWNRLRKGRALIAYFGGIAAILLSNALRISSMAILGNRGFADTVAHYHISAGWIFFSIVFLVYIFLTYRKIVVPPQ
jgi:exosortase/archaeosortase family protein